MNTADNDLDVIIIGGGPGGLSSLMWCLELGLKVLLFEKESEPGGQLLRTFGPINNYPGIKAANGRELCDKFMQHLENPDTSIRLSSHVASADLRGKKVTLADGREFAARAIIIATGVRRRKLGVPGEMEFRGRGVLESGVKARQKINGKTVAIIGGGDAALENALILSEDAHKVIVVHRRQKFTARKEFLLRAIDQKNIELITDSRLLEIRGNNMVASVGLSNENSGARSSIPVDNVLIRIGFEYNTEMFRGQITLGNDGAVSVDRFCATEIDLVYAIGDVVDPASPTISNAIGQGATAVKRLVEHLSPGD